MRRQQAVLICSLPRSNPWEDRPGRSGIASFRQRRLWGPILEMGAERSGAKGGKSPDKWLLGEDLLMDPTCKTDRATVSRYCMVVYALIIESARRIQAYQGFRQGAAFQGRER
jgi:hypothetical protein